MTSDELTAWKEISGIVGATVMAAYLAWKARGRKDFAAPYTGDKGAQPRVVSRKEWHDVVNLVNTIPGISDRVKRNEARLTRLEDEFSQAMNAFGRLETSFSAHTDRWEEVGVEAREHRQRLEAHILRVEEKVDRRGPR